MTETDRHEASALSSIEQISDPDRLRNLIANAQRVGAACVERAAFDKLCAVQPSAAEGSVEHDVWQSVFALEETLTRERGKTTRLSRTRQKIARVGEVETAASLARSRTPSDGFFKLIERGMPHFLFEAVVLRHPDRFDEATRASARARLEDYQHDPDRDQPKNGPANG